MITGVLILFLAALSFTRHGENRYSILIFAALCGLFQFASDNLGESWGYVYYLGAAIADLLIIIAISKPVKLTATIINLQKIALWFIYANTIGWIIYELYYPPLIYDALCLALFISALFVAVKKGGSSDLGNFANNSNGFTIFSGYNNRHTQMQINKKKA